MKNSTETSIASSIPFYMEYCILKLVLSLIGIVTNSISILIFVSFSNTKKKFFSFLKYYTINSLICNINDSVLIILLINLKNDLLMDMDTYQIYHKKYISILYIIRVYEVIRSIVYSFGCCLDIFIIYERIQLYAPNYTFLIKKSARRITLFIIIYCIFLNIPANFSHEIVSIEISLESDNIQIYSYAVSEYMANKVFGIVLLVTYFVRDALTFIIMIVLIIVLIYSIKKYYIQRLSLNVVNRNTNIIFKKSALNNCKIAVIMCFLIGSLHAFSVYNLIKRHYFSASTKDVALYSLFFALKNSVNIFIFIKFNKIFRRNFQMMLPKTNFFNLCNLRGPLRQPDIELTERTERRNSRGYSTKL